MIEALGYDIEINYVKRQDKSDRLGGVKNG
jgi:hypothetical protein